MQQLESFSVQESTTREYYILGKKNWVEEDAKNTTRKRNETKES